MALWGAALTDEMWDDVQDQVVYVLPASCQTGTVRDVKYMKCGSRWYQMVYHGSEIAYVEVPDPT